MEKFTKRNVYEALINYANGGAMAYADGDATVEIPAEALAAFAENEIALLDKKATKAKERAATKKAEGDELTEAVYAAVSAEEFETKETIAARIEGEDVSIAKIQYRLNQLVKAGRVVKEQGTVAGGEGEKSRKVMQYKIAD